MKRKAIRFLKRAGRAMIFARRRWVEGKTGALYFAPMIPPDGFVIKDICSELGWTVRLASDEDRPVIFWPGNPAVYPPQPAHWINANCGNIDKDVVAAAFASAFGRSYLVDPERYHGSYVEKSNRNAAHDGRVLTSPQKPEPGRVYLRLVNNIYGDEVEDLRVIYLRKALDFVYVKRRPISTRFQNKNTSVSITPLASVLSASEVAGIEHMCELLGMDYGEIDVLRDRDDGEVYVLDMNRTPHGPPNGLPAQQARWAVKEMARNFSEAFS